ncbi:HIT family protein [Nonomuraea phyllanthi]|uniref:hypothetical protein n=1 Tax=Nonomuraea phyllanthi TaxID=2219224 RepID=UPI00186AEE8A|nr:hypothetical protein [Nonomuraea phyllanthi]
MAWTAAARQRGLGHVLVIPVAHRPTILDVAPEEERHLMSASARTSDRGRLGWRSP